MTLLLLFPVPSSLVLTLLEILFTSASLFPNKDAAVGLPDAVDFRLLAMDQALTEPPAGVCERSWWWCLWSPTR